MMERLSELNALLNMDEQGSSEEAEQRKAEHSR